MRALSLTGSGDRCGLPIETRLEDHAATQVQPAGEANHLEEPPERQAQVPRQGAERAAREHAGDGGNHAEHIARAQEDLKEGAVVEGLDEALEGPRSATHRALVGAEAPGLESLRAEGAQDRARGQLARL